MPSSRSFCAHVDRVVSWFGPKSIVLRYLCDWEGLRSGSCVYNKTYGSFISISNVLNSNLVLKAIKGNVSHGELNLAALKTVPRGHFRSSHDLPNYCVKYSYRCF